MPDVEVIPLLDAEGSFATWDEAFPALGRTGAWTIPFRAFLLRTGAATILADAAVGPAGGGAWLPDRQGRLLQELERFGVAPQEIELVFLTHLHVDHVGWCGSFPNARYVAHLDDWNFFAGRGDSYMVRTIEPLRAEGAFELLEACGGVAPGAVAVPAPGHTPGHMLLRVEDVLVVGDLAVDVVQVADPSLPFFLDGDPERAAATRRDVLSLAADEELLVAASHLPGNGLGRVVREGEGFAWHPSN